MEAKEGIQWLGLNELYNFSLFLRDEDGRSDIEMVLNLQFLNVPQKEWDGAWVNVRDSHVYSVESSIFNAWHIWELDSGNRIGSFKTKGWNELFLSNQAGSIPQ